MIIKTIRSTGLNYEITETPHSIRKSLDKPKIPQQFSESPQNVQIAEPQICFPNTEGDELLGVNEE